MLYSHMTNTAKKMKFSIKDFVSKCDQIRSPTYLVTLTEEILNGKNYFLCSTILYASRLIRLRLTYIFSL